MARNRFLVCYDVTDDGRLRSTHKKLLGFGDPVQYSVFLCDLSTKERVLLEGTLTELLNLKEDRVLIVDLGPATGRGDACVTQMGASRPFTKREAVVI